MHFDAHLGVDMGAPESDEGGRSTAQHEAPSRIADRPEQDGPRRTVEKPSEGLRDRAGWAEGVRYENASTDVTGNAATDATGTDIAATDVPRTDGQGLPTKGDEAA